MYSSLSSYPDWYLFQYFEQWSAFSIPHCYSALVNLTFIVCNWMLLLFFNCCIIFLKSLYVGWCILIFCTACVDILSQGVVRNYTSGPLQNVVFISCTFLALSCCLFICLYQLLTVRFSHFRLGYFTIPLASFQRATLFSYYIYPWQFFLTLLLTFCSRPNYFEASIVLLYLFLLP